MQNNFKIGVIKAHKDDSEWLSLAKAKLTKPNQYKRIGEDDNMFTSLIHYDTMSIDFSEDNHRPFLKLKGNVVHVHLMDKFSGVESVKTDIPIIAIQELSNDQICDLVTKGLFEPDMTTNYDLSSLLIENGLAEDKIETSSVLSFNGDIYVDEDNVLPIIRLDVNNARQVALTYSKQTQELIDLIPRTDKAIEAYVDNSSNLAPKQEPALSAVNEIKDIADACEIEVVTSIENHDIGKDIVADAVKAIDPDGKYGELLDIDKPESIDKSVQEQVLASITSHHGDIGKLLNNTSPLEDIVKPSNVKTDKLDVVDQGVSFQ